MKCKNCGFEWNADGKFSEISNCLYCGKPLIDEIFSSENLTAQEVVSKIVNQFGEDIILQNNRFIAIFSDYAPKLTDEKMILAFALNVGIAKCFVNCAPTDRKSNANKARHQLEYFLSEKAVDIVISSFVVAFKWDIDISLIKENDAVQATTNIQKTSDLQSIYISKVYSDGNYYEGDMLNGKRHGKGKYTFTNGDIYEGDFVNDKFTGKGKFIFKSSGNAYEGDFVNGDFNGRGKFIWSNGDIYKGDFVNNERSGRGKYIWANGDVYEGDFVNGKRTGKGIFTFAASGNIYEGDFVDGKQTGKGKLTLSSGNIYEGDFKNADFNGKGKYTWSNGDIYEGDFVDGERTGKGKLTKSDGTVTEGYFEDGKLVEHK